jgi:hypothetical protein
MSADACADGWQTYRHDIIGIEFCYPSSWGVPETEPVGRLTRLSDAFTKYSEKNQFQIYFRGGRNERLTRSLLFFNDQYDGQPFANARAAEFGPIDNIPQLKETGDICDYRINFNHEWGEKDTLIEQWSDCKDGIRSALVVEDQFFSFNDTGWRHTYELNGWGYRTLQNGHFDHVLLKTTFLKTNQTTQRGLQVNDLFRLPAEQILLGKLDSPGAFEAGRREFATFVASVRAFAPPQRTQMSLVVPDGEHPGVTTIRRYYWLLSGGNAEAAYVMLRNPGETLAEFQRRYVGIESAEPRDFRSIGATQWAFTLDYADHNQSPQVYDVRMGVSEQNIAILASEEILTPKVVFGNRVAYAKRVGEKSSIVITESGQETVIETADAEYDERHSNIARVKLFHAPIFSSSGRYLTYGWGGWEWCGSVLFDNEKKKTLVSVIDICDVKITNDERYAFGCASGGMSGAGAKVWSLPAAVSEYDVYAEGANEEYPIVICQVEPEGSGILFELARMEDYAPDWEPIYTRTIRYDFVTKQPRVVDR